ncbi:hypothetical protein VFPFJ_10189 [Purpureocillium lilacinum]|uniref:Uncharacterized protein n=1 Tax=Purpureocillium lilacinum TaxID=33203 RepID=A0A179GJV7_PURLI|nr:hypothetical protein VFPFJ_10189 [Purpureocillium lilacinum]OAQ78157.1 hypothetical protein VFPFJ_10189 [Purpureocillium lilacinum]
MCHLIDHTLLRKPTLRVASSKFSGAASSRSESTLRPSHIAPARSNLLLTSCRNAFRSARP